MGDEDSETMREYQGLRGKVDVHFDMIFDKHQAEMRCAAQCHACCAPGLTVTRIEADAIRDHLTTHPELIPNLAELANRDPHQGQRCSLLDAEGRCSIYEARPLICRSHGAPVLVQIDESHEGIDACELNFTQGIDMLDDGDWIHLETLNTMLTLIDWRYALDEGRERPDPYQDRVRLTLEALLDGVDIP